MTASSIASPSPPTLRWKSSSATSMCMGTLAGSSRSAPRPGRPRLGALPGPMLPMPGLDAAPPDAASPPAPRWDPGRARLRTPLSLTPYHAQVLRAAGKLAVDRLGAGGDPVAVLEFALAHAELPQSTLALILGVSRRTIAAWARGQWEPQFSQTRTLLTAFGLELSISAKKRRSPPP